MEIQSEKINFKLENGILYTDCNPNTIMSIEDGQETTKISMQIINGEPIPLLCDLKNVIKMTIECRNHFSGEEHSKTFSKAALLVSTPISRIIGNFFIGLNKPIKPTRLFTNRDKALNWLTDE